MTTPVAETVTQPEPYTELKPEPLVVQSKFVEFRDQDSPRGKSSKHKFRHKRSRSRSNSPRREAEDRLGRRFKKREVELNFSLLPG